MFSTAKNPVSLQMAATQWTALKDMTDVEPVNEADYECLAEIRDVLKKYNKHQRFGVALLHKHFDIADDEILNEETDQETRTSILKPIKRTEAKNLREAMWMLSDGKKEEMLTCVQMCSDLYGNPCS
jgi:hypothetical protein